MKFFRKFSLFSKALLILVFTVLLTALLAFWYMSGEVKKVVTAQIKQGAEDTLRIANMQLQEKLVGGISLLIALRTDKTVQNALAQPLESPAQRVAVAQQIQTVIRNAYYAIETPFKIVIVSAYDDVYANWSMVDVDTARRLKNDYHDTARTALSQQSGLYAQVVSNVELSTSGGNVEAYYIQYLPLVNSSGKYLGMGMVLLAEPEIQNIIRFSQTDIHTTLLLNHEGTIVSAQDKALIGTDFQSYTAAAGTTGSRVIFSKEAARTRLTIVDIMSESYIDAQAWQIMRRLLFYTILSITGVTIAAYFLMRSITKPLKHLTKRLISNDYSSFVQERAVDVGKNEIRLLERGFDVMEEDIRILIHLNEQEQKEKRAIEIAALQSQIQPHFLFNTLNTVRCSILNHHDEKAADLVYNLTALLRMTLVNGDELVTLEKEIEAVGHYLDIIKMRHATVFTFAAGLSPDTAQLQVPKLLLQPLVENCVIHGLKQSKQDGRIQICSFRDKDCWRIQVKNNGAPIAVAIEYAGEVNKEEPVVTRDSFSGIGTKNVYRRLRLYYGELCTLRIYTDEDGLTISELQMPYPVDKTLFSDNLISSDPGFTLKGDIYETEIVAGR